MNYNFHYSRILVVNYISFVEIKLTLKPEYFSFDQNLMTMISKNILKTFFFSFILFGAISCSSDDDSSVDPAVEEQEKIELLIEKFKTLTGKYKLISAESSEPFIMPETNIESNDFFALINKDHPDGLIFDIKETGLDNRLYDFWFSYNGKTLNVAGDVTGIEIMKTNARSLYGPINDETYKEGISLDFENKGADGPTSAVFSISGDSLITNYTVSAFVKHATEDIFVKKDITAKSVYLRQ